MPIPIPIGPGLMGGGLSSSGVRGGFCGPDVGGMFTPGGMLVANTGSPLGGTDCMSTGAPVLATPPETLPGTILIGGGAVVTESGTSDMNVYATTIYFMTTRSVLVILSVHKSTSLNLTLDELLG